MKTTILLLLILLSGCAGRGNLNDFECNQRCGYYDVNMSPIATAMCINSCLAAKGM